MLRDAVRTEIPIIIVVKVKGAIINHHVLCAHFDFSVVCTVLEKESCKSNTTKELFIMWGVGKRRNKGRRSEYKNNQ